MRQRKIPALLISGIYRSSMPFFKWYGGLWKKMAKTFDHFFVQNNDSNKILRRFRLRFFNERIKEYGVFTWFCKI